MIDLKRKRYLELIAPKWLEWVCDFFFTIKTGKEKPWLSSRTGRKYFNTYVDKLRYQLIDAVHIYAKGNKSLEKRLLVIIRYCLIHYHCCPLKISESSLKLLRVNYL